MSDTPIYCWSLDQEEYHGEHDSRESAIGEAMDDIDADHGATAVVWTARVVPAHTFLRGEVMAKLVAERIIEFCDEMLANDISADDYIVQADNAKRLELGNMVIDWLYKNAEFTRYGVDDVEEHVVTVEDAQ